MNTTIIFDWKRTLYDPDQSCLIEGTEELLLFLKSKGIQLMLIGKGDFQMYDEVERLGVKQYFKHIIFQEGKKTIDLFKKNITEDVSQVIVIGGRVSSEIEIGNEIGAVTIWVCQGKFADELPLYDMQKPNYIVNSLSEVVLIVRKLIL